MAFRKGPVPDLPSGTVTFLFTDIEGSTALWERNRQTMGGTVERHFAVLATAIQAQGGIPFKTVGDAIHAAFPTAPAAVAAALAAQRALLAEDWGEIGGLRVRMAVHAGEAAPDEHGEYLAAPLNRLSRLLATAHGGQILLTQAVQQLSRGALPAGAELRDLGEHRLRDLLEPEHVYQLLHPDVPATFPPLLSLDTRPNNLPRQPTPFVGREQQVDGIVDLLRRAEVQLVTLIGPGGTGKTRLALQAAAELLDDFTDGVFFVPLAPLTESGLVSAAIVSALGLREEGGQPLADRLQNFLSAKTLLLVLDNVEHLAEAAPVIGNLLESAAGLKVLATSRIPLHLRAEYEYPVPPLGLPHRHPSPTAEQLSQYEAVRLFLARAQAVKPDFAITNDNASAVAEICWRLDGLPLAIELAASRVRMLSPQAMLARLEQRLPFLTGGARDAPKRQRTLRNAIGWSYDLLQPEEQVLFRRLAVFVGGCTLEAAEAVTNLDGKLDVFAGIERLIEHSLLRQGEGRGGEPHLTILETVREYGLEQLAASGEEGEIREHHAEHFAKLGEETERVFWSRPVPLMAVLEAEADNLRAALGWAEGHGKAETGLRLALAFGVQAMQRGTPAEGWEWLRRVLSLGGGDPPLRARALTGFGWHALYQGDSESAMEAAEQAVATAAGESWILAMALLLLGSVELEQGTIDTARRRFEEALALVEGDVDVGVWAPPILMNLGLLAAIQGDVAEARRWYEATLAALPTDAVTFIRPMVLGNLASMAWNEGDRSRAAVLQREALPLRRALRDVLALANSLANGAEFAAVGGRPEVAARLLGAAEALRLRGGVTIDPFNLDDPDALKARVRDQLGEPAFAAAWTEGESLPLDQAIAEADTVLAEAAHDDRGARNGTDRPAH
jgi:predicted ATPase/class 3 adenylate cyclase/Tfp pilus assembly protein PilF